MIESLSQLTMITHDIVSSWGHYKGHSLSSSHGFNPRGEKKAHKYTCFARSPLSTWNHRMIVCAGQYHCHCDCQFYTALTCLFLAVQKFCPHLDQGCIFRLTCSHPELTEDHVLTSEYVKIFRTVTRNAENKSV